MQGLLSQPAATNAACYSLYIRSDSQGVRGPQHGPRASLAPQGSHISLSVGACGDLSRAHTAAETGMLKLTLQARICPCRQQAVGL